MNSHRKNTVNCDVKKQPSQRSLDHRVTGQGKVNSHRKNTVNCDVKKQSEVIRPQGYWTGQGEQPPKEHREL